MIQPNQTVKSAGARRGYNLSKMLEEHTSSTIQSELAPPERWQRLAEWFEPSLGELEPDYRRHFFSEDRGQANFILWLVIVSILVLGVVDFQFASSPTALVSLLASRAVFVVIAVGCLLMIRRIRNPAYLDNMILVLSMLLVVTSLFINLLRPAYYTQNMIIHVLIVVGCYVVIPGPLVNRLLPAALMTLGSLSSFVFLKSGIQLPDVTTTVATFAITHILGYISASRLAASRRNEFKIWLETEAARNRLEALATTDGLTQLLNRRQFMVMAGKAFGRYKSHAAFFSLILADLDHFKEINDTFGHQAGDRALVTFSNMLVQQLRKYDIAGRMGGEEFAMLLPGTHLQEASRVAERMRQLCAGLSIPTNEQASNLTVSMGVVEVSSADQSLDGLIHRADKALYQAKAAGRDAVHPAQNESER